MIKYTSLSHASVFHVNSLFNRLWGYDCTRKELNGDIWVLYLVPYDTVKICVKLILVIVFKVTPRNVLKLKIKILFSPEILSDFSESILFLTYILKAMLNH